MIGVGDVVHSRWLYNQDDRTFNQAEQKIKSDEDDSEADISMLNMASTTELVSPIAQNYARVNHAIALMQAAIDQIDSIDKVLKENPFSQIQALESQEEESTLIDHMVTMIHMVQTWFDTVNRCQKGICPELRIELDSELMTIESVERLQTCLDAWQTDRNDQEMLEALAHQISIELQDCREKSEIWFAKLITIAESTFEHQEKAFHLQLPVSEEEMVWPEYIQKINSETKSEELSLEALYQMILPNRAAILLRDPIKNR